MFFECFRGQLFENGKRYTNSETTLQKALEERIPNHILHVQFERKISVSQSNLLYPLYVYNDLKRQKMPNATQFLLRNGTESNNTFSHNLLDHSNAFGLSRRNFLSLTSLPKPILCEEGGVGVGVGWIFNYTPFWGPLEFWLDQTGTCTTWLWGLQYKTIIGSLWYLAAEEMQ